MRIPYNLHPSPSCIFLACFCTAASGLPPDTLWTKVYGGPDADRGYAVRQTSDGGYIIAGETCSFGSGWLDVYMIKTGANGDTLWTRTYGGPLGDWSMAVEQTSDSGYIIAGSSYSSGGTGTDDVYLIKTDALGMPAWIETYGGPYIDRGFSVQETFDGGYVVAGWTEPVSGFDVYLVKAGHSGSAQWIRTYGGVHGDRGYSIRQTLDSGYVIAGETASFGAGNWDAYVIRTDVLGDTLWTRTFGGPAWDRGECIEQTSDGGYIMVGFTYSFGSGESDIYVIKMTAAGDTMWTMTYGGPGWDIGKSVVETADGAYVIAGHTTSGTGWDVLLMKIDADGDTLWTKTCGGFGMDYAYSVSQTSDNGYIVVGSTDSYGAGLDDVWLLRLDSDLGVKESGLTVAGTDLLGATIVSGPVPLPNGKKCRILDITGRVVEDERPACGIYFLEVEGRICDKIVMVR